MRQLGTAFCLIVVLFVGLVQAGEKPGLLGQLVFDQSWYDFGEVPPGQKFSHTFTFKVEQGPIHISRVVTGCGCTTVELEKHDYLVGESGEITATVDTTDFNGLIYKEIYVELVGAEVGQVDLALTAKVVKQ